MGQDVVPYAYGVPYMNIRAWDVPYAYGPIYAYRAEHMHVIAKSQYHRLPSYTHQQHIM